LLRFVTESIFIMIPFLYKVAKAFYSEYGSELYKHTFVFPNRRASIFFQKYLAEIAGKPLFSPTMITIQELFLSLSSYQTADRIEMLVVLYNHFMKITGSAESFDEFIYWGEMLLNDFDDVDKYMVDARQLFKNVQDFKSLDDDMSHLNESQIEAIRRFWKNFMPIEGNETKERFQETWQILSELYESFRSELTEMGRAYDGMIFRDVAERINTIELLELDTEGFVFVGFNALTPAEIKLLEYLKKVDFADFYWDYDSPFVHDVLNRASLKVKENLLRFPSKLDVDNYGSSINNESDSLIKGIKVNNNDFSESGGPVDYKTEIEVIGVPSGVGQAKHVSQILTDLISAKYISSPEEAINTAIILPDENLLLPILYSIPQEIGKINVTMGYSLSHSSIAGLIEHIAMLQQNLRKWNNEVAFYHRYVKSVLNHPLITLSASDDADNLKEHILKNNRIVIPVSEVPADPLLQLIFKPITDWREISSYIQNVLKYIYGSLTGRKKSINELSQVANDDVDDDDSESRLKSGDTRSIDLEREFIVHCYKTITRLQDKLADIENITVDTYFRLLKKMTQGISVSFSGEPLSGLQIMGVLETRAIDFENLIILSMNEGIFPIKNSANSFVPYTLRKGFGLPTYEHQDSVYAYHFYRMISRAKKVYMLYDTRAEGVQTGEVSRYFYQIKYLYSNHFNLSERVVAYDVTTPDIMPVEVVKSDNVMRKLNAFRAGGEKSLSASTINNYVDCPLKFYFTAIEGLSEESEVQESIEFDVFGSIFHRVMEIIYNRYTNQTVTPDVMTSIIKNDEYLTEILEKAFARYYFKDEKNPRPLIGQYYLIGEIIKSYVKQTLEEDKKLAPFTYLESEYRFNKYYRVNDGLFVNFKGSIDRIDKVGELVRIIDYKSGSGATSFNDISQLFDSSKDKRPYQILQVVIYGMFYLSDNPSVQLSPAVYYLRSIFKEFNPTIFYGKHPINDLSIYMTEFKEKFNELIEEMFNPEVPFSQTLNVKNCEWCAFKKLCNR